MRLDDVCAREILHWVNLRSDQGGLSSADAASVPPIPTVYLLVDPTHTLIYYVGQSNNLRKRMLAHLHDPKKGGAGWDGEVMYLVPGIESTDLRLEMEAHLILALRPQLNQALMLNLRGRRLVEIRWKRKGQKAA